MVDEISIYVPDRAGELAKILTKIEDAKVNILGLTIDEVQSVSIARLIVDAPEIAKETLENNNYTASVSKVFTVQLPHRIGALSRLVTVLAKAKINIRYIYLMQLRNSTEPVVIIRTTPKQEKAAKELLQKNDFRHVRLKDLLA